MLLLLLLSLLSSPCFRCCNLIFIVFIVIVVVIIGVAVTVGALHWYFHCCCHQHVDVVVLVTVLLLSLLLSSLSFLLVGPEGAELRFRLCVLLFYFLLFYFCPCRDVMRMRHSVPYSFKSKVYQWFT